MDEVCSHFPEEHHAFWKRPAHYQSVEGETFHELQKRAVETVLKIMKENRGHTVLLVSHGAFIKTVLAFFEGRPLDKLWEPPLAGNLAHSIIEERNSGQYEIVLYCDQEWAKA